MKKITVLDRIALLITGLLAAYQIVTGIEGFGSFSIWCFTAGFGVLLVAGLLIILLGFETLPHPFTIIASTIIPLSISAGLIAEFYPDISTAYLAFAVIGFIAVAASRLMKLGKKAVIILALVHGIAGMAIFILPMVLVFQGTVGAGFLLVSLGGALIGVGGLLLAFLKTGSPILSQNTILTVLPGILLLMTASYVAGFLLM